jgi:hypothetical protein
VKRWIIRLLWITGTSIITLAIIAWTLEYVQYRDYMKYNISSGLPGK